MPEYEFVVALDDTVVARDMDLATALILAEALFKKYYAAPKIEVTISRIEKGKCCRGD
jgi:hypothetical protein